MDGHRHKIPVKSTSEELETDYAWSPDRARGYVAGVACRIEGGRPSEYQLIGIDEYALGFREGYYSRK